MLTRLPSTMTASRPTSTNTSVSTAARTESASLERAAATICGDGVTPAASASASGFPPGSEAATASADEGRSCGANSMQRSIVARNRDVEILHHAVDPRRTIGRRSAVRERRPAREHLVEDEAERVEVASHGDLCAPSSCSGAMYAGVPLRNCVCFSSRAVAASPKSVMNTCPRPSIITFAGFRSRCTTPLSCAAARPAHSRRAISIALS